MSLGVMVLRAFQYLQDPSHLRDISFSTLKRISLASAADYTFSRFQGFRGLEFRLLRALYQISPPNQTVFCLGVAPKNKCNV